MLERFTSLKIRERQEKLFFASARLSMFVYRLKAHRVCLFVWLDAWKPTRSVAVALFSSLDFDFRFDSIRFLLSLTLTLNSHLRLSSTEP